MTDKPPINDNDELVFLDTMQFLGDGMDFETAEFFAKELARQDLTMQPHLPNTTIAGGDKTGTAGVFAFDRNKPIDAKIDEQLEPFENAGVIRKGDSASKLATVVGRGAESDPFEDAGVVRKGNAAGGSVRLTAQNAQTSTLKSAEVEREGNFAGGSVTVAVRNTDNDPFENAGIVRRGNAAGVSAGLTAQNAQTSTLKSAEVEREGNFAGGSVTVAVRNTDNDPFENAGIVRRGNAAGGSAGLTAQNNQGDPFENAEVIRKGNSASNSITLATRNTQDNVFESASTIRKGVPSDTTTVVADPLQGVSPVNIATLSKTQAMESDSSSNESTTQTSPPQTGQLDSKTPEQVAAASDTRENRQIGTDAAALEKAAIEARNKAPEVLVTKLDRGLDSLDVAIEKSFDRLPRSVKDPIFVTDATTPASKLVLDSSITPVVPTPGGIRDGALVVGRDSNMVSMVQGATAGQSGGIYAFDRGVAEQGALQVREANVGYVVSPMLSRDSQTVGLAGTGTIGQGMLQPGDVRGTGIAGSVNLAPTAGIGRGQDGSMEAGGTKSAPTAINALVAVGPGAIKGIDDTGKITSFVVGGDKMIGLTDTTTGKKGSTIATEGMNPTVIGSPLGLITTKGDKIGSLDVIDETKLPGGQTPGSQSPLGVIVASTVTATTTTNGSKDPNIQNTTTTTQTTIPTGNKIGDWAETLPEIEIVDITEKDKVEVEPAKQVETITRKEVVVDVDDDDDEYDQFVANEGRRGGGAYTPQQRGFDNVRSLIEIIIADTNGKKLDDTKAQQLFDQLFGDNTKRQYTVKPGDTIEEIALRMLKDKRLIPLLINVNEIKENGGRKTGGRITSAPTKRVFGSDYEDDLYTAELKAGVELELPTRSQILRYKIHVLNDTAPLMVYANTLGDAASGQSAEAISEFISYTCRLGDTLESIAKRHPAIGDESRWEEIARLNELSTKCDENGQSTVVLDRGQTIHLPKPKATVIDELEDEDESGISKIDSVLSAGGYGQWAPSVAHDGETVIQKPPAQHNVVSLMGRMKSATVSLDRKEITAVTRVITQNDLGDDTSALTLRLEMKVDNHWVPVVEYNINTAESGQPSGLKIFDLYGVRQVITLNLPTRSARELAENDITVNSQRYCQLFIKDHQIAA